MKKILYVMLCLLIAIATFLITYKLIPYSQKDVDRVLNITLGYEKANCLDYYRLDVNKDGEIDLYDGVLILNKMGDK